MKIAITASGKEIGSALDPRFGRAKGFIIVDTETEEIRYTDNEQNLNAAQGAGVQAAQNVAAEEVQAVITGHCGPKAFRILSASKIQVFNCAAATVQDALDQFKKGELTPSQQADVKGHWA